MNFVTWNCRVGAFRKKAHRVAKFEPDILVVQEVERIDSVLLFSGECQPTFRERKGVPMSSRGIGMFSYTGTAIQAVDAEEVQPGFHRYEAQHSDMTFNVVAAWTWKTKPDSYRQVHKGIEQHADWIRKRPTVMMGDLNANKSCSGRNWELLETLLDSVGLVSAYHTHFKEKFGEETRHTHFHGSKKNPFHIDYCFISKEWEVRVRDVQVPDYSGWSEISDHVPVVVNLDV